MHKIKENVRTARYGAQKISYSVLCDLEIAPHTICLLASTGRGPEDFVQLAEALSQSGFRSILPWPRGTGQSTEQMNQAVFAFRRYEDASLRYTGVESHS